jgi:hypothetical protein
MGCREKISVKWDAGKGFRLNKMQGKEPEVKWDAGKGTSG